MVKYWNNDWVGEVIDFLSPVTGPIRPEYLDIAQGSVMLQQGKGDPQYLTFFDGKKIAKYDFTLYVRCNGRGRADRKRAADILFAAAEKCETEVPRAGSRIRMTGLPVLFNRNMSGMEEYRAEFTLEQLSEETEDEE